MCGHGHHGYPGSPGTGPARGYAQDPAFGPGPELFRHFIEEAQGQAGAVYGRRMYEVMRYWDDEQPEWSDDERAFGAAWRRQHKWVVSRTLTSVGPNATLIKDDVEGALRRVKAERDGEIEEWRAPRELLAA